MEQPRGTVVFLFTDLEGSTRLWRDFPEAMTRAYDRHDAILRQSVADQGGVVFKVIGDAMQAALPTARGAIAAATAAQQGLLNENWAACGIPEPLRVRMALHAGAVEPDPHGDYRSPVLNRLGRVLSAAHGGQVLVSDAVHGLVWETLPPDVQLRDLGEHRLKDLGNPSTIFQLLHPDLPEQFPPLRSGDSQLHNMPAQMTAFLGREKDLAAAAGLLREDEVRLVTLTGPGGTGKTRLSVQIAKRLLEEFADGVWFVELAAINDPTLLPAAIAEVLKLRETAADSARELIRRELTTRQTLLVLDNFEQIAVAAPLLGELLLGCPGLKILVTSRIALRLRAEHEFPVAPLTLPPRYPPPTAEQLSQFDAVRLFISRAQAARPEFVVDNENAPAVAEICHRLDGLPLAIELAASRIRLLMPAAMLARLEKRLPLLTGGATDAPDRQRTLRQAIAWSYDLLTPQEQALFRGLATFAGGFTLEAAEAVAEAINLDGLDALEGLERLVDQSLLRQMEAQESELRFGMLETIREYGLERLAEIGEEEGSVRRAHARYFAEMVIAAEMNLSLGVAKTLAQVGTERDNLRAALGWLLDGGDVETALRSTASLAEYWTSTGSQFAEGRDWLERALARGGGVSPGIRAHALTRLSQMALHQGDFVTARAAATESLALARAADDARAIVGALFWLSRACNSGGQVQEALPLAMEAEQIARERDVREWRGWTLVLLGFVRHACGDLAEARATLEEALLLSRRLNQPWSEAHALTFFGLVIADQGELDGAAQFLAESLVAHHRMGAGIGIPFSFTGLADIAEQAGEPEAAAWLLGAAGAHCARFGYGAICGISNRTARVESCVREKLGEEETRRAIAAGEMLPTDQAIAQALVVARDLTLNTRERLSA